MKNGIVLPFLLILASVAFILSVFFLMENKSKAKNQNSTQTQSPSPAAESVYTDEGIANWKTYTNTDYGFTFKYPPNWGYQTANYTAPILKKSTKEVTVYFGEYVTKNHIGEIVPPYVAGQVVLNLITYSSQLNSDLKSYVQTQGMADPKWSSVTFNDITATKIEHQLCLSGQCEDILIPRGNTIINFSTQNGNPGDILSTFKFLDQPNEAKFCGGIAGIICPSGYKCLLDGNYPDAGGKCVKK